MVTRRMPVWLWIIAIAAFLIVAFGSMALGRYLQRKGSAIEQHHGDRPPDA